MRQINSTLFPSISGFHILVQHSRQSYKHSVFGHGGRIAENSLFKGRRKQPFRNHAYVDKPALQIAHCLLRGGQWKESEGESLFLSPFLLLRPIDLTQTGTRSRRRRRRKRAIHSIHVFCPSSSSSSVRLQSATERVLYPPCPPLLGAVSSPSPFPSHCPKSSSQPSSFRVGRTLCSSSLFAWVAKCPFFCHTKPYRRLAEGEREGGSREMPCTYGVFLATLFRRRQFSLFTLFYLDPVFLFPPCSSEYERVRLTSSIPKVPISCSPKMSQTRNQGHRTMRLQERRIQVGKRMNSSIQSLPPLSASPWDLARRKREKTLV